MIPAIIITLLDGSVAHMLRNLLRLLFNAISRDALDHARRYTLQSLALPCICALVYKDVTPALQVRRAEVQVVERDVAVIPFANVIRVERITKGMRRWPLPEVARAGHGASTSLSQRARNLPRNARDFFSGQ